MNDTHFYHVRKGVFLPQDVTSFSVRSLIFTRRKRLFDPLSRNVQQNSLDPCSQINQVIDG
jgi:hypothetical protein